MQLYYLIAVIVGMALLNALMFVILKKLADRTGKLIRSSVLQELSVYDHVLGRKLNEALATNEELKKHAPAAAVPEPPATGSRAVAAGVLAVPNGVYRNETFLRDYRRVKQLSAPDVRTAVRQVREMAGDGGDAARGQAAAEIGRMLAGDAAYQLSTLPPEEQETVLRGVFSAPQQALLDEHLLLRSKFDLMAFLEEMEACAREGSDRMTVYTGDPDADYGALDPQIDTVYDAGICEGVRILYRNRLYDYSLLLREVM